LKKSDKKAYSRERAFSDADDYTAFVVSDKDIFKDGTVFYGDKLR